MNQLEIMKSIRKTYDFNPASRPHSSKKGKRGYSRKSRKEGKRMAKEHY